MNEQGGSELIILQQHDDSYWAQHVQRSGPAQPLCRSLQGPYAVRYWQPSIPKQLPRLRNVTRLPCYHIRKTLRGCRNLMPLPIVHVVTGLLPTTYYYELSERLVVTVSQPPRVFFVRVISEIRRVNKNIRKFLMHSSSLRIVPASLVGRHCRMCGHWVVSAHNLPN
jgi:hypothetical protein